MRREDGGKRSECLAERRASRWHTWKKPLRARGSTFAMVAQREVKVRISNFLGAPEDGLYGYFTSHNSSLMGGPARTMIDDPGATGEEAIA